MLMMHNNGDDGEASKDEESEGIVNEQLKFTDLNDDCVERIFNFLDLTTQLNFTKVCTRWSDTTCKITRLELHSKRILSTTKSKIKWEELSEILHKSGSHVEDLVIYACELEKYPMELNTLKIDDKDYIVTGILPRIPECINYIAQKCCRLRRLTLCLDGYPAATPTKLLDECQQLFDNNREIKRFSLSCEPSYFSVISRNSAYLPESITELSLMVRAVDQGDLCRILSRAQNITSLKLGRTIINDQIMQCVVRSCTKLMYFQVDCWESKSFKYMSQLRCLRILDIRSRSDIDFDEVLIAISNCTNLTELKIRESCFSSEGINPFLQNANFSKLVLHRCYFTCNTPLSPQSKLQHLSIQDMCQFDLEKLTSTYFARPKLSDKVPQRIAGSSKRMTIFKLGSKKNVTREDFHRLMALFPNLVSLKLMNSSTSKDFILQEVKGSGLKEVKLYHCPGSSVHAGKANEIFMYRAQRIINNLKDYYKSCPNLQRLWVTNDVFQ